jgi:hypothetical protein
VECDPPLDLCPDCFAIVSMQIGSHRPEHNYRIIDVANVPVLRSEWKAR